MSLVEDVGFTHITAGLMFALEVQQLVETSREAEIEAVRQAYDIPTQSAGGIVESTCRRYVTMLVNKAMTAVTEHKHRLALGMVKRVLKYAKFITSGTVDADGGNFDESHKNAIIACYANELRAGTDPEILAYAAEGDMEQRLRDLIYLDPAYYVELSDKPVEVNTLTDAWG